MPTERFTNVLEWRAANPAQTVAVNQVVAGSIQTTANASKGAAVQFATEAEAARALGISLDQLGGRGVSSQRAEVQAVNQQLDTERQITREMEKQIATNEKAIRGRVGGAGNAGIATGFGGSLRSVGAAVGNLGGGQSVTQAASLIGLAELGPAAVAVGALGLGLKLVTEHAKEAAAAVAASAKAYQEVREAAVKQTREELELERDNAQDIVRIRQQAADEAQAAFREAERNAAPIALLFGTDTFVEGLRTVRDQTKDALTDVQNDLNALNIVLADTSVRAADVAEAERRLNEVRTQYAIDQADILIRLRTTTAEERAERVLAINDEIEILRAQADAVGKSSKAGAEFEQRIISLQQELDLTTVATKTYGDALEQQRLKQEAAEARAESVTERNDMFLEAAQREGAAREKAADIAERIGDITADRDSRLLELASDYSERRFDVEAEGNDRSLENTRDANERRAKIERDGSRDLQNAAFERDAKAAYLANQRTADALEDQKTAEEKQDRAAAKAQTKQLETLDKGYAKQAQSTRQAAENQLRIQQRGLAEQLFLAQTARDSQIFLASTGTRTVTNYHAKMYNDLNTLAFNGGMTVAQSFKNGVNAALGGARGGGSQQFQTLTDSPQGRALDARMNQIALNTYARIRVQTRD